jgi:hypothetical protein
MCGAADPIAKAAIVLGRPRRTKTVGQFFFPFSGVACAVSNVIPLGRAAVGPAANSGGRLV